MAEATKILIGGKWVSGMGGNYQDRNPYNGQVLAQISRGSREQMEEAVDAAREAFLSYRELPAHKRGEMMGKVSRIIGERGEELARLIAQEVGKPIRTARVEVARALSTFRVAGEEAPRLYGEVIPMDAVPAGERRFGFYLRQPIGVIGAITPFNFPLNLVAHKVAPALASGNTVVLRPTTEAPLIALELARILEAADLPPGAINMVPSSTQVAEALVASPKIAMISFTGSVPVGKGIRDRAGLKRVTLELGSNSANVVAGSADLDAAAAACVTGGFAFAGQSCISVQRLYIQREVMSPFLDRFVPLVEGLKLGDPLDEGTDVGPMISEDAAQKVEGWIQEALAGGARVLCGGKREGAFLRPTVLADVSQDMRVVYEEVFAPLVAVASYDSFQEAIAMVNSSRYGLNAGVFTQDLGEAFKAVKELEVGGVIINDTSAYRADHMPYGGVKESGLGREGVRYAMGEMTEIKLAVFNL